jgi:hypothetical protein
VRSLERVAQVLAVLCLIAVVLLNGRPYFTAFSIPPRGIRDPHVALQMARSVEEVDAILSQAPSPDRVAMRMKQYIDLAFIAFYAALFVVMSMALARRTRWAWTIAVFGVLAAIFDVLEDVDILHIVDIPLESTTAQMVLHLHLMSVVKWMFAAVAIGLLGALTLRSRRWFMRLIAAVDFVAAGMILRGLTDNPWLVWAGALLAAGMIANAATLKFLTVEHSAERQKPNA